MATAAETRMRQVIAVFFVFAGRNSASRCPPTPANRAFAASPTAPWGMRSPDCLLPRLANPLRRRLEADRRLIEPVETPAQDRNCHPKTPQLAQPLWTGTRKRGRGRP